MSISSGSKILASDVANHINDKNNPHGITAASIGAAASSHTHDDLYATKAWVESLIASSLPKEAAVTINDAFEYANGPTTNPYVGHSTTLPFTPKYALVTFSQLGTAPSSDNTTQYLQTNKEYKIIQGSYLDIAYMTRTQGSTKYNLYYRLRLTGNKLQYEISYNKYNHWFTANTQAAALIYG